MVDKQLHLSHSFFNEFLERYGKLSWLKLGISLTVREVWKVPNTR